MAAAELRANAADHGTASSRRRAAFVDGFSLHANTSVDAADRAGRERLVRYLLRPMISAERLTLRPVGRVEYRFRKLDPTGRTSWVTDGATWCRRLATLTPPRRGHMTRFHGILASAHRSRAAVVPAVPVTNPTDGVRLDQRAIAELQEAEATNSLLAHSSYLHRAPEAPSRG